MKGSRPGWLFGPVSGCHVGLWAQVEGWGRAFRLDDVKHRFAVRFEVGAGEPGPDMYEWASTRGTTTLMQASDPHHRAELVQQSWRIIRTVVGDGVVSWANEELALHYRVEEDDAFFPVRTEADVRMIAGALAEGLPRMIETQLRRASDA